MHLYTYIYMYIYICVYVYTQICIYIYILHALIILRYAETVRERERAREGGREGGERNVSLQKHAQVNSRGIFRISRTVAENTSNSSCIQPVSQHASETTKNLCTLVMVRVMV